MRTARIVPVLALAGLAGCGDESSLDVEARVGGPIEVSPVFLLGGLRLGCSEAPGVEGLGVRPVGRTEARLADCGPLFLEAGMPVTVTARDGSGLETFASGLFDPTPSVGEVALGPQAGFLELSWSFGERALSPCAAEVVDVRVRVRPADATTDEGPPTYEARWPCGAGTALLPRAFAPGRYALELSARDAEDLPIYVHASERVLDRGLDRYAAVMSPLGGRLLLDWRFALGAEVFDACDDPRAEVPFVRATVEALRSDPSGGLVPEASPRASARLDCASPRPTPLPGARFSPERWLAVTLEAEGARHRFERSVRLQMPSGDALVDLGPLPARGRAELQVAIRSAACLLELSSVAVVEVWDAEGESVFTRRSSMSEETVTVPNLAYGAYAVRVYREPLVEGCEPVVVERVLAAPSADWGAVEL